MITLRPARESDRRMLLVWRNDPETRAASVNHDVVSDAEHEAWFTRALGDPGILLFVGEGDDGEPVGTVRFHREGDAGDVEVSITLNPSHRGGGLSRPLLDAALSALPAGMRHPRVIARIRPENAASLRLFARAGFVAAGTDDDGLGLYELRTATPADPN